jgi:hypothetical protein
MEEFDYKKEFKKVVDEVEEKMNFGLEKYGDRSYQASLENLSNCDTLDHLRSEMIDCINYCVAAIVKIDNIKEKLDLGVDHFNGKYEEYKEEKELI